MNEEWKDIPDFHYEVSTLGNVRNKQTGTLIKKFDGKTGYYVILRKNGMRHRFGVRYLVGTAFVDVPAKLTHSITKVIRPLDGNPYNDKARNLYWKEEL